jgi:hypothetical protein
LKQLVDRFYSKFPEVFSHINQNISRDSYDAKEIFIENLKPVVPAAPATPTPTTTKIETSTSTNTETTNPNEIKSANESKIEEKQPTENNQATENKPVTETEKEKEKETTNMNIDPSLPYVDRKIMELLFFLGNLETNQLPLVADDISALNDDVLVRLEAHVCLLMFVGLFLVIC